MTPWAIACQVPLSMGFSRQEYWSGLPFPSQGDLPNPGMESASHLLHYRQILYCLSHGGSVVTYKGGYKTVSGIPRNLPSLSLSEEEPVLLSLMVLVNLDV